MNKYGKFTRIALSSIRSFFELGPGNSVFIWGPDGSFGIRAALPTEAKCLPK